MSRNLSHLSSRHGLADGMHAALHSPEVSNAESLHALNTRFHVGEAALAGAASFYDFLRPENRAKRVFVCNGTSCELAGTQPALRGRLQEHFDPAAIGTMTCVGKCHTNHAFAYDGRTYSAASRDELQRILESRAAVGNQSLAVACNLAQPTLTGPRPARREIAGILDVALRNSPETLIGEITRSGLSGRGGAHYPTGRKWAACRSAAATPKYVVCNADEGDPGAFADRYLLEEQTERVVLGMILAAYAVGATEGVLYIRAEYPEAVAKAQTTCAEFRDAGLLGTNIRATGTSFDIHVFRGAGAYIVGEETALLAAIEGQRPEVRIRPPYPSEEGLFRKPTVVNNVMTLALVPWIAAHGGDTFARIGTPQSTGPLLVTLDGRFKQPGVYELEMGTPLDRVVFEVGGGFVEPVKAIQTGGPLGGVLPVSMIDQLSLCHESFESKGFSLGHGSFVGIPERVPMIEFMAHLFEFTAAESCGKCFPCRLGSQRGAEMLRRAANREASVDTVAFNDLLDALQETSLCGLGGALPLPIRNILQYFGEELRPFLAPGEGT